MDKELREYLKGFKGELKNHIEMFLDANTEQLKQYTERCIEKSLSTKTEELKRHTSAVYEEFQKRIEIVVEGHEVPDRKIDELKEDITSELKEHRLMTKTLFKDLDYRLKVLERAKS